MYAFLRDWGAVSGMGSGEDRTAAKTREVVFSLQSL